MQQGQAWGAPLDPRSLPHIPRLRISPAGLTMAANPISDEVLVQKFVELLYSSPSNGDKELSQDRLQALRSLVAEYGIPTQAKLVAISCDHAKGPSSLESERIAWLRATIWKIFLGITEVQSTRYVELLRDVHLVWNDAAGGQRALQSAQESRTDASRNQRLCVVVNKACDDYRRTPYVDGHDERTKLLRILCGYLSVQPCYEQGLNSVAGVFSKVLGEVEAFMALEILMKSKLSRYFADEADEPTLSPSSHQSSKKKKKKGKQAVQLLPRDEACVLVEMCVNAKDPELYRHLQKELQGKTMCLHIAILPLLLSIQTTMYKALDAILPAWDLLMCFGIHLLPLCLTAYILLVRDQLLCHKGGEMYSKYFNYNKVSTVAPDVKQLVRRTLSLLDEFRVEPELLQLLRLLEAHTSKSVRQEPIFSAHHSKCIICAP